MKFSKPAMSQFFLILNHVRHSSTLNKINFPYKKIVLILSFGFLENFSYVCANFGELFKT